MSWRSFVLYNLRQVFHHHQQQRRASTTTLLLRLSSPRCGRTPCRHYSSPAVTSSPSTTTTTTSTKQFQGVVVDVDKRPLRLLMLDGSRIRQDLEELIRRVSAASTDKSTWATPIKARLVDLIAQAATSSHVQDGVLAQRALQAVLHDGVVIQKDPALAAKMISLTIQIWTTCGHTHGTVQAEKLLWKLLQQHERFLCDKLQTNVDIYNDSLASFLAAVTSQWPGSHPLPRHVLAKRIDPILQQFQNLVQDYAIRLDWATFGINQRLYVCLKARRTDEALFILQNMMTHTNRHKTYLQPNITTYNTVLQTLSFDGRVDDIEIILRQMVQNYSRNPQAHPMPNHFSVMPWITAFARIPNQHHHAHHQAGHQAEVAWRVVQDWHAQGWVDLQQLQQSLVWAAIAKAWAHAHHALVNSNNNKNHDTTTITTPHPDIAVTRLVELWKQAVQTTTSGGKTKTQVASPRLAWTVLSVLDPTRDWNDIICPMLDQIDDFIRQEKRPESRPNASYQQWLQLYQRLYKHWLQEGAALSAHGIWTRMDTMEPEAAVDALKQVEENKLVLGKYPRSNKA